MPHYDYSIRNKELVLENIKLKEEIDRLLETIRHLSGDKELLIEKQDRILKELGQATLNFAVLIDSVDKQAEDNGLWFDAQTAPEAYLQQELRKLHGLIESNTKALSEPQDEGKD